MELPLSISSDSKEPIYYQIELQLKSLIVSGQLLPGALLPSIRALSAQLACSVITTRRAYQNLENIGLIKTVQGKGTFVSEMNSVMQADAKTEIVQIALRKAIEQAQLLGCTMDEIQTIFEKIMQESES